MDLDKLDKARRSAVNWPFAFRAPRDSNAVASKQRRERNRLKKLSLNRRRNKHSRQIVTNAPRG